MISHRYHQDELIHMIRHICHERRILRYGNTKYSWRSTIFHTLAWDGKETLNEVIQSSIPSFCLLYQHECAAIVASGIGTEGGFQWDTTFIDLFEFPIMVKNIPFDDIQARRLLAGTWIDDEVVNAYLFLCGSFRPDIKFLNSYWLAKLPFWGNHAVDNSILWVSWPFFHTFTILVDD